MMRQYLIDMYLDYINNWSTIEKFSEFHELTTEDAKKILELGKKYHEEYVSIMKLNVSKSK